MQLTQNDSWDFEEWNPSESLINVEKDTGNSGVEEKLDELYKKFVDKTFVVISRVEEMGLPLPGEQIRIVTMRSFNAVHFLNYIAKKEKVKNLFVAVYSINYEAGRFLNEMIKEGLIEKATVLMSNLRNKAHREKEQITRDMFVDNPKIDLFFASSHAKIISMQTEKGNYYTIEGSGNLSYNSRIEQYSIDNDKELFLFTKKWMNEIKRLLKDKKELVLT